MPNAHFSALPDSELLEVKQRAAIDGSKSNGDDKSVEKRIAWRLARELSDEQWIDLVRNGVRPEVLPLSPQQLEAVRGGGIWDSIIDTLRDYLA